MIRFTDLKAGLYGVVGFRQNYNPSGEQLTADLLVSDSGLLFQDEHPIVTLKNIESIAPDFDSVIYAAWVSGTSYVPGSIVSKDSHNWRCTLATNSIAPTGTGNANWELFYPFSDWLKSKILASIAKLAQRIFEEKEIDRSSKSLFESRYIVEGAYGKLTTNPTPKRLVGWELQPIQGKGVKLKVEKLGVMTTGVDTVLVYVFKSGSADYLKKYSIATDGNSMTWITVSDLYLPYCAGEGLYVVIDTNSVTSDLVMLDRDLRQEPCTCNRVEFMNWNMWTKYLKIHPFDNAAFSNEKLPTLEDNIYTYSTNYGLNMQVSAICDHTDILLEQKLLLASAISKQFAVDIMREFAYNPEASINRNEATMSRETILYELEGDARGRETGKEVELTRAIKSIKLSFEGIDRACLPCKDNGIRYRAI